MYIIIQYKYKELNLTEISISEFRKNLKYYSSKVIEDDILVMNNGTPVMKVINPNKNKIILAKSLIGSIPVFDEEEVLSKRLKEL